jgi:hypothetical protein
MVESGKRYLGYVRFGSERRIEFAIDPTTASYPFERDVKLELR